MPWIKKEVTYKVPNQYYVDDFSEGKTQTFTYHGPEYIMIHIEKDTGKEIGWCSWEPEELEVPKALDEERIMIDCKEDTFICELINDQGGDEFLDFLDERDWQTIYEAPPGYESFDIPAKLHLREIYDDSNVRYNFDTDEFEAPLKTWKSEAGLDIDKFTWDHFRVIRDEALQATDGILDEYMPEDLKQQWIEYKQLLRDAPAKLSHIPPYFASMMLPLEPGATTGDEDDEDIFEQIMLPEDES